ncbi:hypothetical protein [Pseudomonas phage KPP25]|uniref:Uncharacterized protein n=1 Tax=Pseudomonas phage KPP25 TaxID=1462608 RepID=X5IEP3_BPKP2|nr:hypothetical protein FF13_gp55 [Pseudomonas phage KPP25]BAO58527.1 hypothetical protein [Pseudomonas phage KPP25]
MKKNWSSMGLNFMRSLAAGVFSGSIGRTAHRTNYTPAAVDKQTPEQIQAAKQRAQERRERRMKRPQGFGG